MAARNAATPQVMDSVRQTLERSYAEDRTIAESLSLSQFQLLHQFNARCGTTPGSYRRAVRFAHAKRMLRDTALPVHKIARRCGYRSHGSFSDRFRALVGCSPSEYWMRPSARSRRDQF